MKKDVCFYYAYILSILSLIFAARLSFFLCLEPLLASDLQRPRPIFVHGALFSSAVKVLGLHVSLAALSLSSILAATFLFQQ